MQRLKLQFHVLDQLTGLNKIARDFQFALIDEDFDGLQTGWKLARNIRQTSESVKIVMVVRKNPEHDLMLLYDVTIGFPISEEQLVGEINR